MSKLTTAKYRFRKHEQIGAAAAEQDEEFLSDCFVDSGDANVLGDCSDRRRIVLGRTGSGKTALLKQIAQAHEHVLEISPEQLSLSYLANSTMLPYLMQIGVDLDQFFRLLWRHVFAVELIKERYRITNDQENRRFLDRVFGQFFEDKRKKRAMEYLVRWGEDFWEHTEYRVQQVTKTLETDIRVSLGVHAKLFDAAVQGSRKLTEQQTQEICQQAQAVVNQVQIRELFDVVALLAEDFLDDPQYRIYIVIDRLDERWVEDRFRYRLIRALIETVGEFIRIRNAKIIVALRRDLIDRVIRQTRSAGFQEEKYQDLYLEINWTQEKLFEVLNRRIDRLIRRRYTKEVVTHRDLLPDSVDGQPIDEYLLQRTLYRPRDIILFFNHCIQCCVEQQMGRPSFPVTLVKAAERAHANGRLRSLGDEWQSTFPDLLDFVPLLKKKEASFRLCEISDSAIEQACLRAASASRDAHGPLTTKAHEVMDDLLSASAFRSYLMKVFYRVGLVGLKTETFDKTRWSFVDPVAPIVGDLDERTRVSIWPTFFSVLGVTARQTRVG